MHLGVIAPVVILVLLFGSAYAEVEATDPAGSVEASGPAGGEGTDPLGPHVPLEPLELAITVDDLPIHDVLPGVSPIDIAAKVMAALKATNGEAVYGFTNGEPLHQNPVGMRVLKAWMDGGYYLGNHTYSHLNLAKVTAEQFIADIEKLDRVLKSFASPTPIVKMFRYPYLSEGDTLEKRNRVRDYLKGKSYRIAPVTVDYADWAWTEAYIRCSAKNDQKTITWLREHVVKAARRQLLHEQKLAKLLVLRDIKHILLLHFSALNSVALQDVLTAFKSEGVRFISLQTALSDPVYETNPNLPMPDGMTFLEQLVIMKGIDDPYDEDIYDVYKVEKLEKLCAP